MRLPAIARSALSVVAPVAPSLAAWSLDRLWFTPPRPRISQKALAILDRHPRVGLDVDGRRITAWSAGKGPTVVLVHGWGGYGAQLAAFVDPLVAAGYRAITFDSLGHGDSDASPLGFRQSSFLDSARAMRAVRDWAGPIHATIAHSGGAIATLIALRTGVTMDRTVLVAPMASPRRYAARFARASGIDERLEQRWTERSAARVGFRWEELDLALAPRTLALPRTFVAHDRDDREVPFEEGQAIARAWRAPLHTTAKLGHRALLRDAGVVARSIEFLSSTVSTETVADAS